MTREEIMAMPAGPDIDRLVAEALGVEPRNYLAADGEFKPDKPSPYSTMIGDAWKAWEAWEVMRGHAVYVMLEQSPRSAFVRATCAGEGDSVKTFHATAPTVPLAICRAFLIWKLEEGQ